MADAKKAYEHLSNFINSGINKKEFSEAFEKDHLYLQGEIFSLALSIIATCAKDEYRFDGRNEFAHTIAKEIVENNKKYF